jgi:hypothetical protein
VTPRRRGPAGPARWRVGGPIASGPRLDVLLASIMILTLGKHRLALFIDIGVAYICTRHPLANRHVRDKQSEGRRSLTLARSDIALNVDYDSSSSPSSSSSPRLQNDSQSHHIPLHYPPVRLGMARALGGSTPIKHRSRARIDLHWTETSIEAMPLCRLTHKARWVRECGHTLTPGHRQRNQQRAPVPRIQLAEGNRRPVRERRD